MASGKRKLHHYESTVTWTGNTGAGTRHYQEYERSHTIAVDLKAVIAGSSDPAFRGDPSKHNPEDLLVASLAACHMLWYLHLCAVAGVVVTAYSDRATGTMQENDNGGGHFTEVTLHPLVTVTDAAMVEKAITLHREAGACCFIANSVNFPVHHQPTIRLG